MHVAIEKGAEQFLVEIVVVMHVLEACRQRVPRLHKRSEFAEQRASLHEIAHVAAENGDQVGEVAVCDVPTLIHVGFTQLERGVGHDAS